LENFYFFRLKGFFSAGFLLDVSAGGKKLQLQLVATMPAEGVYSVGFIPWRRITAGRIIEEILAGFR